MIIIIGISIFIVIAFILFLIYKLLFSPNKIINIQAQFEKGNYGKCSKMAQKLLKSYPQNFEARYIMAKCFIQDYKFKLALDELMIVNKIGRFSELCPEIKFRENLVQMYENMDRIYDALQEYLLLIKLAPNNPQYLFKAALILDGSKKYNQALEYYQQAIDFDETLIDAHLNMGIIYYKQNHISDAQETFEEILKNNLHHPIASFWLAKIIVDDGNYSRALQLFDHAEKEKSYEIDVLLEKGICYLEENKTDRAIEHLSQAEKRSKEKNQEINIRSQYYMGIAYEKQQKVDEALTLFKRVYAANPKFMDIEEIIAKYNKGKPQEQVNLSPDQIRYNDQIKDYITLPAEDFRKLCEDIAKGYHFDIITTTGINGGCQILAKGTSKNRQMVGNTLHNEVLLWFLRLSALVTESTLSDLADQLKLTKCVKGFAFSSSDFTQNAKNYAQNRTIDLIGPKEIQKMINSTGYKPQGMSDNTGEVQE